MQLKKKILLLSALSLAVLGCSGAEELLKNPKLEKNASSWGNWGGKRLRYRNTAEGLYMEGVTASLNQGIAQTLMLKVGQEYEFSCHLKGNAPGDSYVALLNVYYPATKRGDSFKQVRGNFDFWTHKVRFTVPAASKGKVLLRPVLLYGKCNLTLAWVSLKEIGKGKAPAVKKYGRIPVIKPVIHPRKRIALHGEKPVSIKAHVHEKLTDPPRGSSVTKDGSAFVIRYNFTTPGHDALMFDIVKKIDSCARVSMTVHSDGKGHRLFFVLIDKSGEHHLITNPVILNKKTGKINTRLQLTPESPYNIPDTVWGGDKNVHLDLPLKGIKVVLDDKPDAFKGSGVVTIKDLTIGNW